MTTNKNESGESGESKKQGKRLRFHVPNKATLVHKGEHFFHMGYLGLVGLEAHGSYRYAAIALLITIILGFFVKHPEAGEVME